MRRSPAIWMAAAAAIATSACTGSLREQVGRSEVDASVLTTIQPPPCAAPAVAPDPGECLGGARPGDDCLMCHRQGGAAAPYTFAGTLYDATGAVAVAGATIYVQDAAGNIATTITRPNGNFFTAEGFVQYPAKVFVSRCPDVLAMLGAVDEITGANCNTSGCHTAGFRVHLP
jgi:hypothetical protein